MLVLMRSSRKEESAMRSAILVLVALAFSSICADSAAPEPLESITTTSSARRGAAESSSSSHWSSETLSSASFTSATLSAIRWPETSLSPLARMQFDDEKSIDDRIVDLEKELRRLYFIKQTAPRFEDRINIEFKDASFAEAIKALEKSLGGNIPIAGGPPPTTTEGTFTYSGTNVRGCDVFESIADGWGYGVDFTKESIVLQKASAHEGR
jgi:hypothetical protein